MGEVRVKVKLTNAADEALAEAGHIRRDQVRSMVVEALVDTGAVDSERRRTPTEARCS